MFKELHHKQVDILGPSFGIPSKLPGTRQQLGDGGDGECLDQSQFYTLAREEVLVSVDRIDVDGMSTADNVIVVGRREGRLFVEVA